MFPILLSWGPIHIYSFSLFLILSWVVFSFLFWKSLRSGGVDEERIFDLSFYATLWALVGSRAGFVITHWELFSQTPLRIFTLWVQPGLSLYGAWIGGILTLIYLSRRYKVRLGLVLDALGVVLPASQAIGLIGAFLDGSNVGTVSRFPWAVRYLGHVGLRHPIQIYELIIVTLLFFLSLNFTKRSLKSKWPYGLVGVLFFLIYSPLEFLLEFFKDSSIYLGMFSANQWILIIILGEALGAFYVRGGGRERLRPRLMALRTFFQRKTGELYAKFPQRHS